MILRESKLKLQRSKSLTSAFSNGTPLKSQIWCTSTPILRHHTCKLRHLQPMTCCRYPSIQSDPTCSALPRISDGCRQISSYHKQLNTQIQKLKEESFAYNPLYYNYKNHMFLLLQINISINKRISFSHHWKNPSTTPI